jgi:hypothetical protein
MYNFTQHAEDDTWTVDIDKSRGYGVFERTATGHGGGLWFDFDPFLGEDRTGKLVLMDYDGFFALPRKVGALLEDLGYVVYDDCYAD